jgi:16S rRNA (cytidine1402-2'-O)-methyltransferase
MPLIFVPAPLGNLRDITLRALDVLRDCRLIVAEDTRVARRLLAALGLPSKPALSYREQNAAAVTPSILDRARSEMVAVLSDAGMPGISDPGSALVAAARAAGIAVDVLPGPSAALGVAVLSGFDLHRFAFEGFPPRRSGERRRAFARALAAGTTSIWFEAPHRIRAALADLAAVAPQARVFLVREYTKLHEQQLLGTPAAVAAALPEPVRGEIAFAIEASAESPLTAGAAGAHAGLHPSLEAAIAEGLQAGEHPVALARRLAAGGYGDRRSLYARIALHKEGGRPKG